MTTTRGRILVVVGHRGGEDAGGGIAIGAIAVGGTLGLNLFEGRIVVDAFWRWGLKLVNG
jgi:hypothetical protein